MTLLRVAKAGEVGRLILAYETGILCFCYYIFA